MLSTTKGKKSQPRRTVIYGVQGVGKSTFAADAPDAVFLPTESGIDDIDCESFPLANSYDEFIGNLKELAEVKHDRKTLVIDSVDWLEKLIWRKVEADAGVNSIADIDWGKGYQSAMSYWGTVIKAVEYLRATKGMASVLVCHSKIEKYTPPGIDAYDRYTLKLHKTASELFREWADELLFANYVVYTKTVDGGFSKTTQGVGSGERVLHASERPSHIAKNRLGITDTIPMSYKEYAKHFTNQ